jgi:signal transduction histidine kinase
VAELKEEIAKGTKEEAIAIADSIEQNLCKINSHGRRADAIVKGMLEHSRATTGEKQPVDINALAEEYLRLSYHGLRAKDAAFNVQLQTRYDATVEKINAVPEEIGRVLLNLFNNAFYSMREKKKRSNGAYEPELIVSTKKVSNTVQIQVTDNGTGISPDIINKIYQPFFTTKPTGEGTGLGLSLSYDIVTKGHSGELMVDSKEGEGAEFRVQLPLTSTSNGH